MLLHIFQHWQFKRFESTWRYRSFRQRHEQATPIVVVFAVLFSYADWLERLPVKLILLFIGSLAVSLCRQNGAFFCAWLRRFQSVVSHEESK